MSKIHLFCIRFFVVSVLFLTSFFFVPKANAEFTIRPITPDDFLTTMRWLFNADIDGDGYSRAEGDCKDNDPAINPGAPELCDGIDNNCNAYVDEGAPGSIPYYKDADGDDFGSDAYPHVMACSTPWDNYVANADDCDDSNPSINPAASEICDGIDNNCSGLADEGLTTVYYRDGDGDTFGDSTSSTEACTRPSGFVMRIGDCNDSNAAVNPSAAEICDRLDNNCNGAIDEGVTTTFYRDADGDGHGLASATIAACSLPVGYALTAGDCNDGNAAIRPGASEFCDGVDNNCNDEIDEGVLTTYYLDADRDGYGVSTSTTEACIRPSGYATRIGDCNDGVATINPSATEVCDGTDNNCNGTADEGLPLSTYMADADGDGYGNPDDTVRNCALPSDTYILASASLGDDCDDVHASANPGVTYQALGDIDTDCDGSLDLTLDDAMIYEFGATPTSNVYPKVTCGDLNGNGRKNLVVSDPAFRRDSTLAMGAVYILDDAGDYFEAGATRRLSESSSEVVSTYYNSGMMLEGLGVSLATYDIDDDGIEDLVMSAPGYNDYAGDRSQSGALYILYGHDGLAGTVDLSDSAYDVEAGRLPPNLAFIRGVDGKRMGQDIKVAGDIDGDGIVDLVDSNGVDVRVYVYQLQPNSEGYYASSHELDRLIEITSYTTYGVFDQRHVKLGDINNDGLIDMVINNPFHQERYSCLGCEEGQRQIIFGGGALGSYWKAPDEEPLIDLNNMTGTGLHFLAYQGFGRASNLGYSPNLIDLDGDDYLDLLDGSANYLVSEDDRGLGIASYGHSLVDDFAEFGSSYLDFDLSDQSADGASCILTRTEGARVPSGISAADYNGDGSVDVMLATPDFADTGNGYAFIIKNEKFMEIRGGEAYLEDEGVVTNTIEINRNIGFGYSFDNCQIDGVGGEELISLTGNKIVIFRGQPE